MAPEVRESLRAAAHDAGCSMNAYAVQILAAASGDPARFRGGTARASGTGEIERDDAGIPLDWKLRWAHSTARNEFIAAMDQQLPAVEVSALVKELDARNPGYFVEWRRLRRAEEAARDRANRGAA
jgi:hypothetical protein